MSAAAVGPDTMRASSRQRSWQLTLLACTALGGSLAGAAGVDALSSKEAAGGLRAALSKGIVVAVAQLGANNGFLNDPKVAIPLPSALASADHALSLRSEERRVGKEWR